MLQIRVLPILQTVRKYMEISQMDINGNNSLAKLGTWIDTIGLYQIQIKSGSYKVY